jgi:DNA-binding transcriptional LysR family regulator
VDVDFTARLVDVVHEGFDLALRVGPLEDSRLAARLLGQMRYGLFASPAYVAAAGMPGTPQDLHGHARLVFATSTGRTSWVLRPAAGSGPAVQVDHAGRVRASSITLLVQACLSGLGIARLPLPLVRTLPAGQLVPLLPQWQPQPTPVHAVFPSNRLLAPKVRAFIDLAAADLE